MYRTDRCGDLRAGDEGRVVTLCGWVQRIRELGGMVFIDLRDRYGITQLVFSRDIDNELCDRAVELGREFVISVSGRVTLRSNRNSQMPTGDVEIVVSDLEILNRSETPPFTVEDDTDGGDDLRMRYRYLDLRRPSVMQKIMLRHKMAREVRNYMDSNDFIEVETPVLYKSTPEGARDYVVPSRIHKGEFYALPQSPQTLKQLLMVAGFDRYYQIVRCFRDEDLRADRQPEFTQIDCELSFVTRDEIFTVFEGLARHLFTTILGREIERPFRRMPYSEAVSRYGTDKPDLRFGMPITEITDLVKGIGFQVFDNAGYTGAIVAPLCGNYSRKQIDELTGWVRRPQIGASGLIYIKSGSDGSVKSPVGKYFNDESLLHIAAEAGATGDDLTLIVSGDRDSALRALGELRLEMGRRLGLRDSDSFAPLWVVDFPLLEWDGDDGRYYAMHHPFTTPLEEDRHLLSDNPGKVRANAYDLVINGVEIGGGSLRIYDQDLQRELFSALGYSREQAEREFGFLMNAFRYGAPPHGGIAFGFDRWTALMGGGESIRDFIAFPKNNSARDVMIDSPSPLSDDQLAELSLRLRD